ncbi:response regulator [Leeia sp. TBRC 13508]|uniref:Response regulator n=1 Tax=Leeia speluncae TaxID=2884804 RepID=A0ABS8D8T6_9NEIS|nr:response regulator [Leeia speluncae]MCB6184596.1 response regulator [Leeia speluncae]
MAQTILLVDDEENILSALYRLLRQDGYEIHRAVGGAAGLEILKDHQPGVIISDQRMPGMTGVQFLAKAKEICPDSIRIVLSGYTDLKSVTDAINEGSIYKFLTKPWDDDFLRATVTDAFRIHDILIQNKILQQDLLEANELLSTQAELQLMLSEQFNKINVEALETTQAIIESLPVGLIGVSMEGDIVLANLSAEKIFNQISMPGQSADALLPSEMLSLESNAKSSAIMINQQKIWVQVQDLAHTEQSVRGRLFVLMPDPMEGSS